MPYRPSRKRPLAIKLLAFTYIFAPVLMPLQVFFYNQPGRGSLRDLLRGPSLNSWLVMATSVIVGIGIFRVRRWGWYLFLLHSTAIVANNVYLFNTMPSYPFYLMLLSNVVLFCLMGMFIWGNVRAPYFNPRIRWWEQAERVGARYSATLGGAGAEIRGETLDFSASGAFIQCDPKELDTGSGPYPVTLYFDEPISCAAQVVWKSAGEGRVPPGVGIKFVGLTRKARTQLRQTVQEVKARAALRAMQPQKDRRDLDSSSEERPKALSGGN